MWGVVFGSIGLGYFVYGKKQNAIIPLLAGLALMIFPYIIPNVYILVIFGVVVALLPYFIRGA